MTPPAPRREQLPYLSRTTCWFLLIVALAASALAQQGQQKVSDAETALISGSALSLELIMADPDWLGREPQAPYWSDDGATVYFTRKRAGSDVEDLFALPAESGDASLVAAEERSAISVAGGTWSRDRRSKVYIYQGDLFVRDLESGTTRQLTRTVARESDPIFMNGSFSATGAVGFRRGDQFLARDLTTGLEQELFPLVFKKAPEDEKRDADRKTSVWAQTEKRLFEIARKREQQELEERLQREELARNDPNSIGIPFYLGEEVELGPAAMSPDGRFLLAVLLPKKRPKPERTDMPEWVTASGHVQARKVRPKVGAVEPFGSALVLLDRATRKVLPLDETSLPDIAQDPLADLREAAEKREKERLAALAPKKQDGQEKAEVSDEVESGDKPGEASGDSEGNKDTKKKPRPRPVRFRSLEWNHDGTIAAFQAFSFDNKDRWLATVQPQRVIADSAKVPLPVTPVHHLHDEAWVNWSFHDFGWTRSGQAIWFLSEESGYSHLYRIDLEPGDAEASALAANDNLPAAVALTEGAFVVSDPELSQDGRYLYFRANKEHPGVYEIYRVALEQGSPIERITHFGTMASARLSPDGKSLVATVSEATRPPELYVQPASPPSRRGRGDRASKRTSTTSEAFLRRQWHEPEFVEIPSSHVDRPIHARLYLPDNPEPNAPAVFFVHGAGYLQNAHKGWSGYFREFMFHSFLIEQGFVVLDMDYRASAGYGRDWRTAIYRQMGTPELEDLRDGVNWLVAQHGVDRNRIGVYGGSYGGFLTLMALFQEPDLFAAGAALRPVTDWAHYNHGYTANILNTPELDPEAYLKSSPIEFAEGLEKPLLMCSPMLDDNVLFQDSVRLVQRLIELEKKDWWIAPYPVEPHGFRQPSSWLDEYRRIYDLFERFVAPTQ